MKKLGTIAIVMMGIYAVLLAVSRLYASELAADPFSALLPSGILVAIGAYLITRRERLADRWFQDAPMDIAADGVALLKLALIFIGLLFLAQSVYGLMNVSYRTILSGLTIGSYAGDATDPGETLILLMPPAVLLLIGVLLIRWSTPLAKTLWPRQREAAVAVAAIPGTGRACPVCGEPYDPADYRPDAAVFKCSRCGEELDLQGSGDARFD